MEERIVNQVLKIFTDRGVAKSSADIPVDVPLYGAGGVGLDSLDMAVFSSLLEQEFGTDPFSHGQFPRTVAEVVRFYDTQQPS
jgi:acyl carrier protein